MLKTYICILVAMALVSSLTADYLDTDDTDYRLEKRTMADQRMAELRAIIALNKINSIPVGHGMFDLTKIGRRRRATV